VGISFRPYSPFIAGFSDVIEIPTASALPHYEKGYRWSAASIGLQGKLEGLTQINVIDKGVFEFPAAGGQASEAQFREAIATVSEKLKTRGFTAKGEVKFELLVAPDDDSRFWVRAVDEVDV
jgi:hypothetical protein